MKTIKDFKKLLKLNRLYEVDQLSPQNLEILESQNLVEIYKILIYMPKNWCIKITLENREIVKEWWYNKMKFTERAFSIGAFYGILDGQGYSKNIYENSANLPQIDLDQFKQIIKNEQ